MRQRLGLAPTAQIEILPSESPPRRRLCMPTQATEETIERWHRLTPEAGRQVVTWAAEAVVRGWRRWKRKLGTGVITVGAGASEAAVPGDPRRRRLRPKKPALLVLVEKRWRRKTTTERRDGRRETSREDLEAGAVPPYVTLRVPKRLLVAGVRPSKARGSVSVAVPTDVVELARRVRPHGAAQPQRLRVVGSKPGAEAGTACAFVRDVSTDERFLLGCHHVIRRSRTMKDAAPDPKARIFVVDDQNAATEIGVPAGHVTFCWKESFCVDAALVRLNPAGTSWVASPEFRRYWRTVPVAWVHTASQFEAQVGFSGARTLLHTKDGTHVLTQPRQFFNYPIPYGNRVVRIAEVHVWDARPLTQAGESGGAAINADVFVGMYIAGDRDRAWTMPPWLYLGPAIKPFHLDLATPGT
jgi:hypothetical protein